MIQLSTYHVAISYDSSHRRLRVTAARNDDGSYLLRSHQPSYLRKWSVLRHCDEPPAANLSNIHLKYLAWP